MERKYVSFIEENNSLLKVESIINSAHLPNANYFHIILRTNHFPNFLWGIPDELVTFIPPSFSTHGQQSTLIHNQPKILYFFDNFLPEMSQKALSSILSVFNSYSSWDFWTFLPNSMIEDLIALVNDNVILLPFEEYSPDIHNDVDMVLTSGKSAVHFLMANIPVIVVGPYGLGGQVCDSNLEHFIQTEFMGRIGGSLLEDVPVSLLDIEIKDILNSSSSGKKGNQLNNTSNELLENTYFESKSLSEITIQTIHDKCITLFEYIHDGDKFLLLVPKISSNIKIFEFSTDRWIIINIDTGKYMAEIKSDEYSILKCFEGRLALGEICSQCSLAKEDIWDFVKMLWEEKIIILIR